MRLSLDHGWVDLASGELLRSGEPARLSAKELAVLQLLVERAGAPVSLDELHTEIWNHGPESISRAAYHTIARLRKKLEVDPRNATLIRSAYAEGYAWGGPTASERFELLGREECLRDVEALLADHRLVVLMGPGGVGKTQLSKGVAPDAPFCDLSAAQTMEDVLQCVALALGVSFEVAGSDAMEDVLDCLVGEVVVVDNAEQVVDAVGELLGGWVRWAGPAFLVTSRIAVAGGHAYPVPPLVSGADIELLTRRGRKVRPGLSFDGDELAAARALLARLGGLPLAIELAAARLGVVGTADLLASLESADAAWIRDSSRVARHQSLDAVLDWSWQLLSAAQQRVMATCAVFRGRFTVGRAATLLGGDDDAGPLLASLCSASLLFVPPGDTEDALQMLMPIRAYASLRLAERDDAAAVALRHARLMADLPPGDVADIDDLWGAVPVAIAQGEGNLAAKLALALFPGMPKGTVGLQPMLALFAKVLRCEGLDPSARARVKTEHAQACWARGRTREAIAQLEELLEHAADAGIRGRVHYLLASILTGCHQPERARPHLEAARAVWTRLGERRLLQELALSEADELVRHGQVEQAISTMEAIDGETMRLRVWTLQSLGLAYMKSGQRALGEERLAEALRIGSELTDATTRLLMGVLATHSGSFDVAMEHFDVSSRTQRRMGYRRSRGLFAGQIGWAAYGQGNLELARSQALTAVSLSQDAMILTSLRDSLVLLGEVERRMGRLDQAERCFSEAASVGDELPEGRGCTMRGLAVVALERGQLVQARTLAEEALSLVASFAPERASCLAVCGHIAALQGDWTAVNAFEEQLAAAGDLASVVFAEHRTALDELKRRRRGRTR